MKQPPRMNRRQQLQELYEERAAIMEYDGKLSRPEAERLAWGIVYSHRTTTQRRRTQ